MLNKVIEKISEQQKGKENTAVYMAGEQLKEICRFVAGAAEIVLADLDVKEMSIDYAEKKIKEYADKQKRTGGCVCVPPNVAENIIKDFYGLSGLEDMRTAETNSQTFGNLQNESRSQSGFIDLKDFL